MKIKPFSFLFPNSHLCLCEMNPPHTIRKSLLFIGQANRQLAVKLPKLPEIRLFRTYAARLALDNLLHLYRLAPGRFDEMFAEMDGIGMTGHRDYCSPPAGLMIADTGL